MIRLNHSLFPSLWVSALLLMPALSTAHAADRIAMDATWNTHLDQCEALCSSIKNDENTTECMFSYGFTIGPMWTELEQIPSQAVYRAECEEKGYLKGRWNACKNASFDLIKVQQQWAEKERNRPDAFEHDLEEAVSNTYYALIAACNWETLCHP